MREDAIGRGSAMVSWLTSDMSAPATSTPDTSTSYTSNSYTTKAPTGMARLVRTHLLSLRASVAARLPDGAFA